MLPAIWPRQWDYLRWPAGSLPCGGFDFEFPRKPPDISPVNHRKTSIGELGIIENGDRIAARRKAPGGS